MKSRLLRFASWLLALGSCTLVGAAVSQPDQLAVAHNASTVNALPAALSGKPLATLSRQVSVPGASPGAVVQVSRFSGTPQRPLAPTAERWLPSRLFGGPTSRRTRPDPQQTGWRLDELEAELTVLSRLADQQRRELEHLARARPIDGSHPREDALGRAAVLMWGLGAVLIARALMLARAVRWRAWLGPFAASASGLLARVVTGPLRRVAVRPGLRS
jgi:hypothetical protein